MKLINNALKKLNLIYYSFYLVTLALGVYIFMTSKTDEPQGISPKSTEGIALSSFVIIYILISIPGSLAWFHKFCKKWSELEDENLKFEKYTKGASFRLIAVGTGLLLSVIIFSIMRSDVSTLFCAGIAGIALIFCKPSANKIMTELNIDED